MTSRRSGSGSRNPNALLRGLRRPFLDQGLVPPASLHRASSGTRAGRDRCRPGSPESPALLFSAGLAARATNADALLADFQPRTISTLAGPPRFSRAGL